MENTALNFKSELEYLREMEHIVTEDYTRAADKVQEQMMQEQRIKETQSFVLPAPVVPVVEHADLLVFALQFRTTDGRIKQMNQYFVVAENMADAVAKADAWLVNDAEAAGLEIQAIQASGLLLPRRMTWKPWSPR